MFVIGNLYNTAELPYSGTTLPDVKIVAIAHWGTLATFTETSLYMLCCMKIG